MEVESLNIHQKITQLEENELKANDNTEELIYKNLLVCYLLDNQPMKAKFLWKRIPCDLKASATESQSELHKVLLFSKLLIERKYPEMFTCVKQLTAMNYQWSSSELGQLIERLVELTKERLLDIINLAYMSINIQELADMLGITAEEAIKVGLTRNWTLDETKSYLMPLKKQNGDVVEIANQVQMQQLTSLVSFLENLSDVEFGHIVDAHVYEKLLNDYRPPLKILKI